jgi:hypothetical protein
MKRALASFRFYLAARGWRATLALSIMHPYGVVQRAVYNSKNRERLRRTRTANRQFDERFGVETHTGSSLAELGVANPSLQSYKYAPVSQEYFDLAMAAVDVRCEDFVFVDLGSGKGKALLLASDYPFQRIIGVEFSPVLHRIAVDNLSRYRNPSQRCWNIESVCEDATEYDFPLSPLIIYLFHPFGPDLLNIVLARLESSLGKHPRPCVLVMVFPLLASVVRERGSFLEGANGDLFTTFRHSADPKVTAASTSAGAG